MKTFRYMPENQNEIPDSFPPNSAQGQLSEWEKEYDRLDGQGQMTPAKIHEILAKKFFANGVSAEEGLADLRRRAFLEKESVGKTPDTVVKILENPVQQGLFDDLPASDPVEAPEPVSQSNERPVHPTVSQPSASGALAPKTEGELNYEHFEVAFRRMQESGAGRADYVTFDTVMEGKPVTVRIPWLVATTLVRPNARRARIACLLRVMYPDVPVE